jgi:hypothetical protein
LCRYWIDNQYYDLDERTLAKLNVFISTTLVKDGSSEVT